MILYMLYAAAFFSHAIPTYGVLYIVLHDKNSMYMCVKQCFAQICKRWPVYSWFPLVLHRAKYYKMASQKELDAFLSSPERFVPPGAPQPLPPPELLPRRRTHADVKAMFPKQFEIQGFCPVSYVDGNKRYMPGQRLV